MARLYSFGGFTLNLTIGLLALVITRVWLFRRRFLSRDSDVKCITTKTIAPMNRTPIPAQIKSSLRSMTCF
jgi:hypothetical protein